MKIDFIHIGYQKTASTFLQSKVFPECKGLDVLNCSDDEIIQWFFEHFINVDAHSFSEGDFIREFDEQLGQKDSERCIRAISDENLCGDIYTGLESKQLMQRLHEVFGETQILIVIRNQVDLILSTYSNYVLHGGTEKFPQWIWGEPTRHGRLLRKVCYSPLVADYIELFGRERVCVVQHEQLFDDKVGLPNFLSRFGLSFPELPRKRINPGTTLRGNAIRVLMNRLGLGKMRGRQRLFALLRNNSSDRSYAKSILGAHLDEIYADNRKLEVVVGQKLAENYYD